MHGQNDKKPIDIVSIIGDKIIEIYKENDICIGEILANLPITEFRDDLIHRPELSFEEVFEIYMYCKIKVEQDIFYVHQDGELLHYELDAYGVAKTR